MFSNDNLQLFLDMKTWIILINEEMLTLHGQLIEVFIKNISALANPIDHKLITCLSPAEKLTMKIFWSKCSY